MKEQIEEMAKALGDTWVVDLEGDPHDLSEVLMRCDLETIAEQLYDAGYRKQSEWISVAERLPTWEDGKVLIYTAYGISIAKRTVNGRWKGDCAIPKLITHWMPLPETPKMKGEE